MHAMTNIEKSFYAVPTLRAERHKDQLVQMTDSILSKLSDYNTYLHKRIREDKQSAFPLLVRLTEMDIAAGLAIVGDDTDLLLDVLTNKRVIVKHYSHIKRFVENSKQIVEEYNIPPADPRLQKINVISNHVTHITDDNFHVPSFREEFSDLSLQDHTMIESLDSVYKKLLSQRKIKSPESKSLTLEDETHQYLRMQLAKLRGEKTVVDPEYQLKSLNQHWEQKLLQILTVLYPSSTIKKEGGSISVDGMPLDTHLKDIDMEPKQMFETYKTELSKKFGDNPYLVGELRLRELSEHTTKAYVSNDSSWQQYLDQLIDFKLTQVKFDTGTSIFGVVRKLIILSYEKNDQSAYTTLLAKAKTIGYIEDHFLRGLTIASYKKGDMRWKEFFDKTVSGEDINVKNQLLLELSLISIKFNDNKHAAFLNQIQKLEVNAYGADLIVEGAVAAYESGNHQAFETVLKLLPRSGFGYARTQMYQKLAIIAYRQGKPYSKFTRRITKTEDKIEFELECLYIDAQKTGEYKKLFEYMQNKYRKSSTVVPFKTLRNIINSAYEINDQTMMETALEWLKSYFFDAGKQLYQHALWQLSIKAFEQKDSRYKTFVERLDNPYKGYALLDMYTQTLYAAEASHAYTMYKTTSKLDASSIVHYFNSLPIQERKPYNTSPLQAKIVNKLLREKPSLFIEQISAFSQSQSEFSADILIKTIFANEILAHLSAHDRAWAMSGYDPALLNKNLPDRSAEDYLAYHQEDSLEGGDPRGAAHKVLETNIPRGHFLITHRLTNINERGRGDTIPLSFAPITSDNTYTVSYLPKLKKGTVSLSIPPNSSINILKINGETQVLPTTNVYAIESDNTTVSYEIAIQDFPNMPLVAYDQESSIGAEELKNTQLPYELELFVDEIQNIPLARQIAEIQNMHNRYFLHDPDNKRVASLKTNTTLRQRLAIMRKRAEEIKKESSHNDIASIRWAGVCSDIAFITATLLAKLDIPFYVDNGLFVFKSIVTTQSAHSQLSIPLADEEGKKYDLAFDPTNNTISIGNVKVTHEQLQEIIPVDPPLTTQSLQEDHEEASINMPSILSLVKTKPPTFENQELYTKIASIGETLVKFGRLDHIQEYILFRVWSNLIKTHQISESQAREAIFNHALTYIKKRGGTITKDELQQLITSNKGLGFLVK